MGNSEVLIRKEITHVAEKFAVGQQHYKLTFRLLSSFMNLFSFRERFFFYWNFIIFKAYL